MKKVLLVGATGYLGRHIAEELIRKEYPTKIFVRNSSKVPFDTKPIDVLEVEVTRPETFFGRMEDIDVVISSLGITKQKDGFTYMDVDYQGNLNLLKEAEKAGVDKFIYVSALNAEKLTHLKMCAAKEKFVEALKKSPIDYCIVRPNGFFSDMAEFLKMARKGRAELFGDGRFRMNPIHGADLAKVCVNAIDSNKKNIEVGGPEVYTHREMVEIAFRAIGKEPKIRYTPEWMRKTILWFARTFSSSKTYGPMEFFFTVLAMDMLAPTYGTHTLPEYYNQLLK